MTRARAIRPLLLATALVALASTIYATPAAAATVTVTTTADENGTGAGCSLREAVQSANADTDFGGCTRVGGHVPDLIFFAASPTGTPIVSAARSWSRATFRSSAAPSTRPSSTAMAPIESSACPPAPW